MSAFPVPSLFLSCTAGPVGSIFALFIQGSAEQRDYIVYINIHSILYLRKYTRGKDILTAASTKDSVVAEQKIFSVVFKFQNL